MPTYQYLCTECAEPLEAQQKFSEPSLTECPSCSGRLRKVYNAVGVVFKGSGFYRNDSRGADPSSSTSGEKSGDKSDDKSGDKSGDSSKGGDSSSTSGDSGGSSESSKSGSESSTNGGDTKSKATTPA